MCGISPLSEASESATVTAGQSLFTFDIIQDPSLLKNKTPVIEAGLPMSIIRMMIFEGQREMSYTVAVILNVVKGYCVTMLGSLDQYRSVQ